MRYEVGHVQAVGKYSGKERRLYFVRDRVAQRLVFIHEGYRNFHTPRKHTAQERADALEAINRTPAQVGRYGSDLIRRG